MMYYLDYICAILVRILNLILHVLPIKFNLWLGRQFGTVVYLVNTDRRIIGYTNLRAAFCKEKTPGELKRLIKNVYKNLTQTFLEILSLTKVNKKYINKYIEVINAEDKYQYANHPHGVILLTAHFGNWELSGIVSSIKGFPLVILAREQKMKRLNELINRLRESKGSKVVRKGITTKYIVKALHEGKIIGMTGDQDAGKMGILADFFGRPASTASGTARIAAKTGAIILPAFMARIKGPYHRLVLEEAIKIKKGEDIEPYLVRYNKLLEKYVRMYPDQWLWLHRRWKSSPIKKVIILSDGKTGHLNQALAVCRELKKYRARSGYGPEDTEVHVEEVRFKNTLAKWLLNFVSIFCSRNCQGCMRCVRVCLAKDSYENLMKRYCDIVISCGSSVASLNKFLSVENNAKNAVIMKPSVLGLNKFNMVILPRHDSTGRRRDHVIVTDTVPNLIDESSVLEASRKIASLTKLERSKKIGVLLGGDNSDFALTDDITEALLNNVISASRKLDFDLLFTTSRRTSREAEKAVKDRLYQEKCCKFLVIANEKNIPNAVSGILGLSDVVVVSGESVSMISEAIYSKKTVVVFRLKKKRKRVSKFEKMLDNLEKKGYITVADAEELSDVIARSLHAPKKQGLPEDHHNIYMHMWRLGV